MSGFNSSAVCNLEHFCPASPANWGWLICKFSNLLLESGNLFSKAMRSDGSFVVSVAGLQKPSCATYLGCPPVLLHRKTRLHQKCSHRLAIPSLIQHGTWCSPMIYKVRHWTTLTYVFMVLILWCWWQGWFHPSVITHSPVVKQVSSSTCPKEISSHCVGISCVVDCASKKVAVVIAKKWEWGRHVLFCSVAV